MNLENIEDEELVALCQKEIDSYRSECYWQCAVCGNSISYIDSLIIKESSYVHEMKCNEIVNGKKCLTKMSLERKDNKKFESYYFEEIFSRYKDMIEKEANNFDTNSDIYPEIYSTICFTFFKSVGMFNRDDGRKKTSNKWFKTFFYTSLRNKLVDIRKTSSYIKRTPTVRCACCDKEVGQITIKHLMSDGHGQIISMIQKRIGENIIKESGEILYYDGLDVEKRKKKLGERFWELSSFEKKETIFKNEAYKTYSELYPNAYFKNNTISTNQHISENSQTELEDNVKNKNENYVYKKNAIDVLYIESVVESLVKTLFEDQETTKEISNYFYKNTKKEKMLEIVKEIIKDKIYHTSLKNSETDRTYEETKEGLTNILFKIIKNDKKCLSVIKNNT